ncbi:MAG: flippase, partial [Gemmatimonadales bacterium]
AWLWERGGPGMLFVAIPLHFGYQLLSAAAVPIGAGMFLLFDEDSSFSPTRPAVTGTRFFALAFGETGARLIAFVTTAYLARRLGASAFGQIGFATAVLMHFGPGLLMGTGEVGSREVARNQQNAPVIAATGITLRVIAALVAMTAILTFASVLGLDPERRTITSLYALCVIPIAFDTSWVYKGLGRTGRIGMAILLVEVVCLVLVLIFVKAPADVTRVPLTQLTGSLTAAAFLTIPLMRGHWPRPTLNSLRRMARQSAMITVSRVLRVVVVSLDVILLGFMVSSQELGWYSAAYRIVFFVMALLYAAHSAFLPEIAQSADNPRALSAILSRAIGMALAVTIPFVVGGVLIARPMMNLIFGAEYQAGAGALQLLLFSLVLLAVHAATRSVFLAMHRLGLETAIIAVGVATNIALNLYLIPRYGIEGAAVATVAGEAVILAGAFITLARLGVRPSVRYSIPAVIAAALLAGVLLLIPGPRPVVASIAAGGIAYVIALAAGTILLRPRVTA